MSDIVLAAVNAKYIHASFGLRCLFANLGPLQHAACMMEFDINQRPADIAEALVKANPKILGLGIYIWNVEQVTELTGILKRVLPETAIVLGGPEVSHEWESQPLALMADYIVTGEGDVAFAQLCSNILAGCPPQSKVIAAEPPDLNKIALPYSLYTDRDLAHRVIYVETSRGCPFRCEFCLSSLDLSVRFFSLPDILAEFQKLLDRGARQLKFVDRTFNANERHAVAILDFFLERMRPGLFLHFELVPDRLPNAVKERIGRFPPGAIQLEIGIQTFNSEVAERIQRRQDNAKIESNLRHLREQTGAHLHTDLIFGLPGESWESFAAGFDRLVALHPHEIQVGMLKRLRGVPIVRHDDAFAMRYNSRPPYEILRNKDIDFLRMQQLRRFARAWDLTANSGNFIETTPLLWQSTHSPFHGFLAWSEWLHARAGTMQGVALTRLAEFLFQFLTGPQKLAPAGVAPVLLRDYWRGGRNDIPPFLREHIGAVPGEAARPAPSKSVKRQSRHGGGSRAAEAGATPNEGPSPVEPGEPCIEKSRANGRFLCRDAAIGDAPAVRELFSNHLAALGYEPDAELDADMMAFPQSYSRPGDCFIVAEVKGALAGMAGLKDGEIRRLFVAPAFRRQGLAGQLVQALIERHRHQGPLTAIVASTNDAAKAVFTSCGFRPSGARPDHPKMRHCEILRLEV